MRYSSKTNPGAFLYCRFYLSLSTHSKGFPLSHFQHLSLSVSTHSVLLIFSLNSKSFIFCIYRKKFSERRSIFTRWPTNLFSDLRASLQVVVCSERISHCCTVSSTPRFYAWAKYPPQLLTFKYLQALCIAFII